MEDFVSTVVAAYTAGDTVKSVVEACRNSCEGWCNLVQFKEEKYCKRILYRDKNIECILIGWLPGQRTPPHSHPKNGCVMRVLSGSLCEIRQKKKVTLMEQSVSFIGGGQTHSIFNASDTCPAVSFHVYSPPCFYNDA